LIDNVAGNMELFRYPVIIQSITWVNWIRMSV